MKKIFALSAALILLISVYVWATDYNGSATGPELDYVHGVTSAVQTQLNTKLLASVFTNNSSSYLRKTGSQASTTGVGSDVQSALNLKLTTATFTSYSGAKAAKAGIQVEAYTAANDTGTANAYAITVSPAPTLSTYSWFSFKALYANTGASTLAVNGGAAKNIYKYGGTLDLSGGEIQAGQIVRVIYDGTQFQMQSQTARPNVYIQSEYDNGTCTTAATITPVNGARQKVTLTNAQACALTFTQPTSGTALVGLKVIQSAISSYNGTISGCKWAGGVVMIPTTTTGAVDFISIYLDGTNAYCAVAGQAFQ